MNVNVSNSNQRGAAMIVAMVALIVLTLLGVSTMGDVLNQSTVVRNEQFSQKVFYAALSELNVQINTANESSLNNDDTLVNDLVASNSDSSDLGLLIDNASTPPVFTNPTDVKLEDVSIDGARMDFIGCPGESISKVNVLAGNINATALLDDGRESIRSVQQQRYVYCW